MTLIIALNYSCLFAFIFREQKLEMLLPWESLSALLEQDSRPARGATRGSLGRGHPHASSLAFRAVWFLVLLDTSASLDL